jgi:lipopolysaccharide transport system permease protein
MKQRQNQFALWLQFTRREIETRHRGSHLGMLWMILSPLLEFAIYATVFGVIFGGRYGVVKNESALSYALGVFLSLCVFRLAADTLSAAPGVILNQTNLVKKVVFPLHLLPLSMLGGLFFRAAISMSLLAASLMVFGPTPTYQSLWLPLVLLPLLIGCVGAAWLLSALGVFLRDIGQLTGPVTMVMLYSSAVFYSADKISARNELAWSLLRWNPLLHVIEDARRVVLWGLPPAPGSIVYVWACSLVMVAIGWATFKRLRPAFADVL